MIFSRKNNKKNQIIEAFSEYVDKDTIEEYLKSDELQNSSLSEIKDIYYILYHVRDDSIKRIYTLIEKSLNVVLKYEGIYDLIGSFVIVYYRNNDIDNKIRNTDLAKELLDTLKKDIRLIHGKTDGKLDNLGIKNNLNFGPVILNFGEKIEKLVKIEFGEIISE